MHENQDQEAHDRAARPDAETERLVAELEAIECPGWYFGYEYPGYFCFTHETSGHLVLCTPDWDEDEVLPIQVQDVYGRSYDEIGVSYPLPATGRTGRQIFDLVRPTLTAVEALGTAVDPRYETVTVTVTVSLTREEIAALTPAHDLVRTQLAHTQSWETRDAAMGALGKIIDAARQQRS